MPRRPRSEAGIVRRLLNVMVNEELLKAIKITSVYANVRVIDVVEDAFKIYLLLYQGKARLVLEQGTELSLASMSVDKVTTRCGSGGQSSQVQKPPTPVGARVNNNNNQVGNQPRQPHVEQPPTGQPQLNLDLNDTPSFIRDNPWLAIIARKSS
jgi:hypothetical protein